MRDPQDFPRIAVAGTQLQPAQHVAVVLLESLMNSVGKLAVGEVVVEPGQYVRQSARSVDTPDVRVARAFENVDRRRLKVAQRQFARISFRRNRNDGGEP